MHSNILFGLYLAALPLLTNAVPALDAAWATLDPIPPTIPLLTMIRLAEDAVAEIQKRHCPPAETYVFGLSLQMWPVFQKGMTEHVESLKKLSEGSTGGYFSRASTTTDAVVESVSPFRLNG